MLLVKSRSNVNHLFIVDLVIIDTQNSSSENRAKYTRSSRPELFCRKGVVRNFEKFAGKHLCRVSFSIKLQALGLRPALLLKKRLWHRYFLVNLAKFLTIPFFIEHLRWLLLNKVNDS